MKTSRRFDGIGASETVAIAGRAAELRRAGHDVISFAAGEPDFATPTHVVEAMARAARDGATRYPPSAGLPELRAAVARNASQRYEVELEAEQVIVTPGAKYALWAAFQALVDPGDEVLVPTPCWVSYAPQIALAGGTMVAVPTAAEDGFRVDVEMLRRAITPRTVGIALNLPNNPTGAIASHEALAAIGDLAVEHDLWIICDDIYAELRFAGGPYPSPLRGRADLRERVVLIDGLSKSHAMTGWRIGYAIAPRPLLKALGVLVGQTVTGVTTFVQHGAIAALEGDQSFLAGWLDAYRRRSELVVATMGHCGMPAVRPEGAFYSLIEVRSVMGRGASNDVEFAKALLDAEKVAVVPGAAFRAPGYVRLSFACADDVLRTGLERIERFVGERPA